MTTKVNFRMVDGAVTNVVDFGAVGDGVTDDAPAIQAAIDSLTKGGKVFVPRGRYRISTRIFLRPYINLIGEGWSVTDQTVGTVIVADAGQSAIMLEGQASLLQDVSVISQDNSTGSNATGVAIRHLHCTMRNVNVGLFGGKGITVDSRSFGNNCNEFRIDNCRSYSNGSDGLFIDGVDSNAGLVTLLDTTGCGGTGIWCKGSRNTFMQCHIDMAGIGGRACFDDAISNVWNVYVENAAGGGSNFQIGSASSHGTLEALFYAKPDIIGDNTAMLSWRIYNKDGYNIFALNDTYDDPAGSRWQMDNGVTSAGTLRLRNTVDAVDALRVTRDGSRFIFSGHLESSDNGVRDVGTTGNRFRTVYCNNANISNGASGSFTAQSGEVVTVTNGVITAIV